MLTCREVTDSATDYLEGEMPWWRRPLFRLHLWMCKACAEFVRQIEGTVRVVGATPSPDPDPEVRRRLLDWFLSGEPPRVARTDPVPGAAGPSREG